MIFGDPNGGFARCLDCGEEFDGVGAMAQWWGHSVARHGLEPASYEECGGSFEAVLQRDNARRLEESQ